MGPPNFTPPDHKTDTGKEPEMLNQMLVEIRQQELLAEAARERLARAARAAESERRTLHRGPSIAARLRGLGRQLRRPQPVADDTRGAI